MLHLQVLRGGRIFNRPLVLFSLTFLDLRLRNADGVIDHVLLADNVGELFDGAPHLLVLSGVHGVHNVRAVLVIYCQAGLHHVVVILLHRK